MGSTILQLCQDACDEPALSLGRPSTLFASDNNGDDSDRKLLRALTATCRYLQKQLLSGLKLMVLRTPSVMLVFIRVKLIWPMLLITKQ